MTRLYRLLHFGQTRLMICVATLSSILPALLLQHGVLSLRDFIVVSYPLHLYNILFPPICKVFYYIKLGVLGYYVFALIAYHAGIALVMLVYRVGICYHISMGVKTKEREVRIEYMRLDEIQRDPSNPKDHDLSALAESLERFGFVSPMGINEKTGKLLWGHGRLDDLVAFMDEGVSVLEGIQVDDDGMWKAPVVRGVHLNSKDGTAYLISDNRQVELGGWNEPKLVETLIRIAGKDGHGLRGTGYDGDDVDTLIRLYRPDLIDMPENPGPQIDKAEELQEKWQVERGQIWEIGRHRLMCGDSTSKRDVERLMREKKADWVWIDPPYGVSYVGKTSDALTIESDSSECLAELLRAAFIEIDNILCDGTPIYVAHPPGALQVEFGKAFLAIGWHLHQGLVWVKNSMVLGHSDYHYKHEPMLYGWKGSKRPWYGNRDQVSIFEIDRPSRSEIHPTMKPVALVSAHLRNSSKAGDLGIDFFLGSGTTMVAAEQLNRICYGMEIEPKYCAVTLERMSGMGLEPRLVTP